LFQRALVAEAIGTFALVFAGAGAVMVDAKTHALGHVGVALTFGLVIMAMIYAVGHISGAHFNAAVTFPSRSAATSPGSAHSATGPRSSSARSPPPRSCAARSATSRTSAPRSRPARKDSRFCGNS
jgi:Major intrinsic protein